MFESVATIRNIRKGNLILEPGEVGDRVSFINSGLIRMFHLIDGKEFIHAFFHENCYYSDYESFLSRKPSTRYSEALEDCELIEMNYDDLQHLYATMPECERAGRKVAEELFVMLSNKTSSFMMKTPADRYFEFLEQYPSLPQRVPQYMIASCLGITPEALSRIRNRRRKGLLTPEIDLNQ